MGRDGWRVGTGATFDTPDAGDDDRHDDRESSA